MPQPFEVFDVLKGSFVPDSGVGGDHFLDPDRFSRVWKPGTGIQAVLFFLPNLLMKA